MGVALSCHICVDVWLHRRPAYSRQYGAVMAVTSPPSLSKCHLDPQVDAFTGSTWRDCWVSCCPLGWLPWRSSLLDTSLDPGLCTCHCCQTPPGGVQTPPLTVPRPTPQMVTDPFHDCAQWDSEVRSEGLPLAWSLHVVPSCPPAVRLNSDSDESNPALQAPSD